MKRAKTLPPVFASVPFWKRAVLGVCVFALPIELYLFALYVDSIPAAPPPLSPREISRGRVWTSIDADKPGIALANLEAHLKAFPSDGAMRLEAAKLYEKEHQLAAALAHYQSVEGRPAGVARTVGATFRSRPPAVAGGSPAEAWEAKAGSPLPPPTPAQRLEAATGAARCYAALDRHDLAALEWEAAARLAPKDAKVRREMGLALYRSGDSLRAMDALYQSLALDPDQSDLHALISEIAMGGGPRGPGAGGDEAAFAPPFAAAFEWEGQIAPRAAPRAIDPARYGLTSARNPFDASQRLPGPRAAPHPRF